MRNLFSPEGEADLAALAARRPLLAFDFDGTLAPIVAQPQQARVPLATARRLRQLGQRLPVAVISGRSLADLRSRLGFEPAHVVGNHGAEDPHEPATWSSTLDGLRERLRGAAAELQRCGVSIEDKGASLALHYRLAADRSIARTAIERLLGQPEPQLHVFGGKMVTNVVPAAAGDKAAALRRLVERTGAGAVLYLGDDVNDEPVFAADEASWLSVRVGVHRGSAARYFIAGPREVPRLLDRMLALTAEAAAG
ncbi:MAG: putative glycosyl hydrolase [Burkholderiaceae bacterium]|nr:putative glycosyl hydrolase [Burkholderiaceae bacterium]